MLAELFRSLLWFFFVWLSGSLDFVCSGVSASNCGLWVASMLTG